MNKEYLELLINKGYSTYSIARKLNKGQTTIRYWLKKYNLKTLSKKTHKICVVCNNETLQGRKYCKTCRVKLQRLRHKIALVNYKGGKCIKCGVDDIFLLDFHHVNPDEKTFTISHDLKAWNTVKTEVDKCILLCANCHRIEHKKDYYKGLHEDAINYKGTNKELKRLLESTVIGDKLVLKTRAR